MSVSGIKGMIEKELELDKNKIEDKKNNINSNYILAKHDFVVIENLNDSINTLTAVLSEIDALINRIVERNRK